MTAESKVLLNNGKSIPMLAMGTWLIDNRQAAESVATALRLGYHHIDTAQAYGNEEGVAVGIRRSGIAREQIWITSKVAAEHKSYASALASIDETLAKMKLDYIDMMIIHSPQPWAEVNQSDNRYLEENREVWRALEDAAASGKVGTIGVSNFRQADLENILSDCRIRPAVNQILAHISNTPIELIDYCKQKKIAVEAYSPVAHGEALKNPIITKTAEKYGVSAARLCIRYCMQLGMIALPKATSEAHLAENMQVNFEISEDDMQTLLHCEHIRDYGTASFFPVYGGKL